MKEPELEGLTAARRYAGWHIGDPQWANNIIYAYLNPDSVNQMLDEDDVPKRTGTYR